MMSSPPIIRDVAYERSRYTNKLILAPMVRVGTLPMRLLALQYGADLVYTEELVDHKMINCRRVVNEIMNTIDFVLPDETVVFRTCAAEKDKVIFQMGTADPGRALQVAQLIYKDVAGIDINMGCPKDFSIAILTTLINNIPVPITCKIRILSSYEETIALARLIESTGVAAMGLHGRTIPERPRMPAHYDHIKAVAEAVGMPVIANGGSLDYEDFDGLMKFKEITGCSSVMMGRTAMWNPSCFRPEGLLTSHQQVTDYIKLGIQYGNRYENSKFNILQLMREELTTPLGKMLFGTKEYSEAVESFGLQDYLTTWSKKHEDIKNRIEGEKGESERGLKRRRTEDDVIEMEMKYVKHLWTIPKNPKTVLLEYTRKNAIDQPKFKVVERPGD
eukprot:Ihof_evm1s680 gene=Ihof_evmTU1s680